MSKKLAEYIWLDGAKPTRGLRSKARVIDTNKIENIDISVFPEWGYDGSSTAQADGSKSDLILKPIYFTNDPLRVDGNFVVFCEVFNADNTEHSTNSRALLRQALDNGGNILDAMIGFEQEYTFFEGKEPLGWPKDGEPEEQGPYYCGVGSKKIHGRDIVEVHTAACLEAGINIYGINAEVMPGQWEYQLGYRGFKNDNNNILTMCDQQWIARWLLQRIAEEYDVSVSFDNKPKQGNWNGAGCHTNFSTKQMRDPNTGRQAIDDAIKKLEAKHADHIELYGDALDQRLTGLHETCSITEFKSGVSDRGASIRIPLDVAQKGYGYIEDRRPGANSDPYLVASRLMATINNLDNLNFALFKN